MPENISSEKEPRKKDVDELMQEFLANFNAKKELLWQKNKDEIRQWVGNDEGKLGVVQDMISDIEEAQPKDYTLRDREALETLKRELHIN